MRHLASLGLVAVACAHGILDSVTVDGTKYVHALLHSMSPPPPPPLPIHFLPADHRKKTTQQLPPMGPAHRPGLPGPEAHHLGLPEGQRVPRGDGTGRGRVVARHCLPLRSACRAYHPGRRSCRGRHDVLVDGVVWESQGARSDRQSIANGGVFFTCVVGSGPFCFC
jgi:hypothetical protein